MIIIKTGQVDAVHRVFIAEDEETTRDGLCRLVDWAGMGLAVCGSADNGADALARMAALAASGGAPHILLTDVVMPVMDGVQLARGARARDPVLRIVFLSGYGDTEYLRAAIHVAASDYLLKPVNMDELEACMRGLADALDKRGLTTPNDEIKNITADTEVSSASSAVRHALAIIGTQYTRNLTVPSIAAQVFLTPKQPPQDAMKQGLSQAKAFKPLPFSLILLAALLPMLAGRGMLQGMEHEAARASAEALRQAAMNLFARFEAAARVGNLLAAHPQVLEALLSDARTQAPARDRGKRPGQRGRVRAPVRAGRQTVCP
jgi:DNA-binding NarL/FixJ family response regulator